MWSMCETVWNSVWNSYCKKLGHSHICRACIKSCATCNILYSDFTRALAKLLASGLRPRFDISRKCRIACHKKITLQTVHVPVGFARGISFADVNSTILSYPILANRCCHSDGCTGHMRHIGGSATSFGVSLGTWNSIGEDISLQA